MKTLSLVMVIISQAVAAEVNVVVPVGIAEWSQPDQKGVGDLIWEDFTLHRENTTAINSYRVPIGRAVAEFANGQYDCMFASYPDEIKIYTGVDVAMAQATLVMHHYVVTNTNLPILQPDSDFSSYSYATFTGARSSRALYGIGYDDFKVTYTANDRDAAIRMVQVGRADVTTLPVFPGAPLPEGLQADFDKPLFKAPRSLNCRFGSEDNALLIQEYNEYIFQKGYVD